jgi:ribosome maturation factor RimP
MSVLLEKIEKKKEGIVREIGCNIVRVKLLKRGKGKKTLQIMIEKLNGSPCNIDDCEKVSRAASAGLDVWDFIDGKYTLEVSSAGIDRPLVKIADFQRFCGSQVTIRTYTSKNERQLFKGNLASASEDGIRIVLATPLLNGEAIVSLKYEEISDAYIDGFKSLGTNGDRNK